MYTINSFKRLLLDLSDFKDLPEQWLRNRDKLVPYVARAHQFAEDVAGACYRDGSKAKTHDFKEYDDCQLSASVLRKTWRSTLPPGFTFDTVPCVSVTFKPICKSLGRFIYDYEPRIDFLTFRYFLTEDTFIKVQAEEDRKYRGWGRLDLKSFSLVKKAVVDEKNYYLSSTSAPETCSERGNKLVGLIYLVEGEEGNHCEFLDLKGRPFTLAAK